MKKKILVLGGNGYIGSEFINSYKHIYNLINYDNFWFKKSIPSNIKSIKDNVLNIQNYKIKNIDTILYLANIANDPTSLLDSKLSWETNVLASMFVCEFAIQNKIKNIIYFSSGSVYGISKSKKVTEDHPLKPISDYNKSKMISERVFESYRKTLNINIVRPATVCGVSKRLRLDVSLNLMTYAAYKNKKIIVHGGQQVRPNINIKDLIRVIHFLIEKKIKNQTINAGFENLKLIDLAKKISNATNAKIQVLPIIDKRSYYLNSDKLLKLGFKTKYNIKNAIDDLTDFFTKKKYTASDNNYNLKTMMKKI